MPLRDGQYTRLVHAVMGARNPVKDAGVAPLLSSGDVAILLDAGYKGNKTKLLQPWKQGVQDLKKKDAHEQGIAANVEDVIMSDDEDGAAQGSAPGFVPTLLTLAYTEESVTQNRRRQKYQSGLARVSQTEWVHIVSESRICLPSRKRINYPGSTVGDIITNVEVPATADEWHMQWGVKKEYYGKKMLVAVGGRTEVAAEDKHVVAKTSSTMVPVAYHLMPDKFYEEMIHTFFTKCVIDLTPVSGKLAWTCLKNKTGMWQSPQASQ